MKSLLALWRGLWGEPLKPRPSASLPSSPGVISDGLWEKLEPHLVEAEGFCHPEWNRLWEILENEVPAADMDAAWDRLRVRWLARLCDHLGGGYRIYRTANFLILADSENEDSHRAVPEFEKTLSVLMERLPGVAQIDEGVKMAALVFSTKDDYYRYLSHFYEEGEHPMSGGMFVSSGGLRHFVFPPLEAYARQHVIAHELTHGCLSHLPLPAWLNEAVAMRMEEVACGSNVHVFDSEVIEKVRHHFNRENLRSFWEGASWANSDEGFELSYSLAMMMWRHLEVDIGATAPALLKFISLADVEDAGDAALRECFGLSLGQLADATLGEGTGMSD